MKGPGNRPAHQDFNPQFHESICLLHREPFTKILYNHFFVPGIRDSLNNTYKGSHIKDRGNSISCK